VAPRHQAAACVDHLVTTLDLILGDRRNRVFLCPDHHELVEKGALRVQVPESVWEVAGVTRCSRHGPVRGAGPRDRTTEPKVMTAITYAKRDLRMRCHFQLFPRHAGAPLA
jgi:hypothetical protein